ncbi:MAG: hypothetical protein WKG03_04000 [Telluria sp.]
MNTNTEFSPQEEKDFDALLSEVPEFDENAAVDCGTYKMYRPILMKLLPWIKRIPKYGKKIVMIVKFLMKLADGVCHIKA